VVQQRAGAPKLQRSPDESIVQAAACADIIGRSPEISDAKTGMLVHDAIWHWFRDNYGPPLQLSIAAGSSAVLRDDKKYVASGEPGSPDLAYRSKLAGTIELGEIKPANAEGYALGAVQLQHYIDKGNADEGLKRQYGVTRFTEMQPSKFPLPRTLWVMGRRYALLWCTPGLLLYKQVEKQERDKDKREDSARQASTRDEHTAQAATPLYIDRGHDMGSRVLVVGESGAPGITAAEAASRVWGNPAYASLLTGERSVEGPPGRFTRFAMGGLGPAQLVAMPGPLREQWAAAGWPVVTYELPAWLPADVAAAARNGRLAPGLDTTSWTFAWPAGFSSRLIVLKTSAHAEFQVLYPEDLAFYEALATRAGQSRDFARRLHTVCTEWNAGLLSLFPDQPSIVDAKDRLRAINDEIFRNLILAFGTAIASAGAAPMRRTSGLSTGSARAPRMTGQSAEAAVPRATAPPAETGLPRAIAPPAAAQSLDDPMVIMQQNISPGASSVAAP
jgi:hypothetical protein